MSALLSRSPDTLQLPINKDLCLLQEALLFTLQKERGLVP